MTAEEIGAASPEASSLSLTETLQRKKASLEAKLKRLYDLYSEAGNEVLLGSINDLLAETGKLDAKIAEENDRGLWSRNAAAAKEQLRNIEETWPYMDMVQNDLTPENIVERGEALTFPDSVVDYFRGMMFRIVSSMIFPAVSGAVSAGSPSAHMVFMSSSRAASKSIPPGREARSIRSALFEISISRSFPRTRKGTVLIIVSKRPSSFPKVRVSRASQPIARI